MGLAGDLKNLEQLHGSGGLSDSEYFRAKAKLISDGVAGRSASTRFSARNSLLAGLGVAMFVTGVVKIRGDETVIEYVAHVDPQVAAGCQRHPELPTKWQHRDGSDDVLEQNRSPATSYPCRTSAVVPGRSSPGNRHSDNAYRVVRWP